MFSNLFYDETVGYFHWRLGLALDKGVLSIVSYLRGLLDEQEQLDWTSWVVPTAQYKMSYFHYCTYNPFRAIDVHLETQKIRGDGEDEDMIFDIYAVDKNGRRSQVQREDTALWKELRIAGVLRYMARQLSLDSFDPKITPLHLNDDCLTCFASREYLGLPNEDELNSGISGASSGIGAPGQHSSDSISAPPSRPASRSNSRISLSIENLPTSASNDTIPISLVGPMSAEEAFLEFLVPFLPSGLLLGPYTRGSTPTIVNNLMIQISSKYMLRQGCSNVLIDWACRMSIDIPEMISVEAKARRKTPVFVDPSKKRESQEDGDQNENDQDDATTSCVNALLQAVSKTPNSLDMLIELSATLLGRGERNKAAEYANLAVEQFPDDYRAVHCAAKVYASSNQPEEALRCLFSVSVCQPPPCKDFVGIAFHRYTTEPHYDFPNADQIRRIEEVDLAVIEESEADLSLSRANLNKVERQFYRLFHTIVKISGRDVLVKIIKERAPKIREAQEKARNEQKRAMEIAAQNRPPPRNRRATMKNVTSSKKNNDIASTSKTNDSIPSPNSSQNNSSSDLKQPQSTGATSSSPSTSPRSPLSNSGDSHASSSASSVGPITENPSSTISKAQAAEQLLGASAVPPSPRSIVPASSVGISSPGSDGSEDFHVIDMDSPLPPPLTYHLDVSYDTLRHAYLSLLEDLRTVERWIAGPSMSVAALVRLGLIHKRLGAYDLALECFETALTVGWSFVGCRELCFLHVQTGKVRQTLECADRSLRHLTHRWGTSYPDWQLKAALWRIVSRKGLKHVLHILENLQEVNDWHPFLRRCLEDAPYHQVDNSSL